MVRFRTRLTTLIGEISQKKWKNGKGSLKLKMDNVTISFSEMFGKKFYWRNVRGKSREYVGSNPTLPSGHPLSFSPYEGMGSWM